MQLPATMARNDSPQSLRHPELNLNAALLAALLALATNACALSPPKSFIQTFDEPGRWASIEIKTGQTKEDVWRTVVDTLAQKFDLEVLEKDSGYVRTSWKYTYVYDGRVVSRYRARIVVKFRDAWRTMQVKCEANWLEGGGWTQGYDTRLLEDAYGDLQGKVGFVRR